MKPVEQQIDNVRGETQRSEKKLTQKRRERQADKKGEQASINERLVAPALLIITILISYIILLFS